MDGEITINLIALTFTAGLATILAPCILPIIPIFISNSSTGNKLKPLVTALGLVTMFVFLGVLITGLGQSIGLDQKQLEKIAGVLLVFVGYTYINVEFGYKFWGSISRYFQKLLSLFGIKEKVGKNKEETLLSSFISGASLGVAWIPCTGPTLGLVLSTILGTNQNVIGGGFLLLVYSIGSILPILLISYLFRGWLERVKFILKYETKIKQITGWLIVVIGLLILTGWIRVIEASILDILPNWKIFNGF